MRPLSVLIAIVTGSAVALTISLTLSGVVFLLLPQYADRLAPERWPLIKGLMWSWSLAGVGVAAFAGEVRNRPWRFYPQLGLVALLAALGIVYWP
jgi:hypothetical protein